VTLRLRAPLEQSILEEGDKELPRVIKEDRLDLFRAIYFESKEAECVSQVGSVFKTHLCSVQVIIISTYQLYIALLVLVVMNTLFDEWF